MRVAYLAHWSEGDRSGVFRKMVEHADAWRELGCEVSHFILSRRDTRSDWRQHAGPSSTVAVYRGWRSRMAAMREVARAIRRWAPHAIYHRFDTYHPQIESLARRFPLVCEVNSDDLAEYALGSIARAGFNRLTRGRLLRCASGLVFVSRELSERSHFTMHAKPALVIGNGIVLSRVPTLAPCQAHQVGVAFIGTPGQRWHGVDKIAALARACPDWRFEIVGYHPDAAEFHGRPNVTCHGVLPRSAYAAVLARCDIALGSLALHRLGINEISPLKVREYLAFGLPIVVGNDDPDLPGSAPYVLRLPNVEQNVAANVDRIRTFATTWKGRRVARADIEHLDSSRKEATRLAFLRQCTAISA